MNQICIVIRNYDNRFADNVLEIIKQSGNCQVSIVKTNREFEVEDRIAKRKHISVYSIEEFSNSFHMADFNEDIVIIGADIKVSLGWLEKLNRCAYQAGDIATVSPLFAAKEYRFIHDEINNNNSWKIRRPYGGCLYIKGQVLFEIGRNIFCMESEQDIILPEYCAVINKLGYIHMLAGNVVCYSSIKVGIEEHKNIGYLVPELYHELWAENSRRNILFYSFADFKQSSSNNIGGTQLHLKDLVSQLKYNYNVIVAARDQQYLQVTRYTDEEVFSFRFYIGDACPEMTFYSEEQKKLLSQIISAFHIDIIHVQHLLGMAHDIFDIANEQDIPIMLTVHDFYYICPLWRLINSNGEICTPAMKTEMCASCLNNYRGYDENINYILRWRNEYRKIVQKCTKIIFPSYSAKDVFTSFYPEVSGKDIIIEHGINKKIFEKSRTCNIDGDANRKIRIAFIGGISEIKGGELIYNMIKESNSDIEWHLIGGNSYEPLRCVKRGNVKYEGWYERENLFQILKNRKIDIVCILSIVSETYCYALSEAIACGIPVIASDIGALGNRVKEMKCGWLVSPNSTSEEVLALINDIKNTPGVYQSMWEHVQNIDIKDIRMMAEEYGSIYNLYDRHISFDLFDIFEIVKGKHDEKYNLILSEKKEEMMIRKLLEEREILMSSIFYKVWHKLSLCYDVVWRKIMGRNK